MLGMNTPKTSFGTDTQYDTESIDSVEAAIQASG